MNGQRSLVRADNDLLPRLAALLPSDSGDIADTGVFKQQDEADILLARVVWSRLVEPGDAVAGALISALGPLEALDLLTSAENAPAVCARVSADTGTALEPAALTAALKRWTPRLNRADSMTDMDRAAAANLRVLTPETPFWPESLADLGPHAPILLWTLGNPRLLSAFSLAVVGARACTEYGTHVTAELTDGARQAGAVIVSGAAYGIDAVAHRTALAAGGETVAVLAGGVDRPYPASHRDLLARIADSGVVCSEMVPGSAPTRWRFLQRNRSIAALSSGVLVTEAGARSGSINTAGHAAELGRPLAAVPGPVTSPASAGCHRLIREYGAALVSNVTELQEFLGVTDELDLLGPGRVAEHVTAPVGRGGASESTATHAAPASSLARADSGSTGGSNREPPLHRRVLDALPLRGSRVVMDVSRIAGVTDDEAHTALAELELLGYVVRRETPTSLDVAWALKRGK